MHHTIFAYIIFLLAYRLKSHRPTGPAEPALGRMAVAMSLFFFVAPPVMADQAQAPSAEHMASSEPVMAPPKPLAQVNVQLKWMHQFQFAGYYAAVEQGFYRDVGLEVNLLEHQLKRAPAEVLLSGDADYAVMGSDVLIHRSRGDPLVALAAIFQHSAYALLVRADAGIFRVEDLAGKRVMLGEGFQDAALQAMLRRGGLDPTQYQRQSSSFDVGSLLDNQTDAFNAYITDQGFTLQERGVRPQYLVPRQYGIDFYGDILVTTEQELADHPERVALFRKASLKGWKYALSHPAELVELILEKYNSQNHSRARLLYEARTSRELIQPLLVQIGHMNPSRWEHIRDVFAELQLVEKDSPIAGLSYQSSDAKPGWLLLIERNAVEFVLAVVILVALLLLALVLQMRRLVAQRTAELADSERRYRTIFNAAPEGMWIIDPELKTLDVNERLLDLLGYRRDEMLGKVPMQFTDRKNAAIFVEQTARIAAVDRRRYEIELQHKDGHNIATRISAVTVRNRDASTLASIAFVEDITVRKAMEIELRRSEKNLRTLIDAEPACVKTLDRNCQLVSMNSAGLQMIQANNLEQVKGASVLPLIDKPFREAFSALNDSVFDGQRGSLTFSLTGLRGDQIWLETHAVPIFNADGQVVRQLSVTQDVTLRRQMEQQLQQESEFLQRVIDSISDSVLVIDTELNIQLMNRTVRKRLTAAGIDPVTVTRYPDLPTLEHQGVRVDGLPPCIGAASPIETVLATGKSASSIASLAGYRSTGDGLLPRRLEVIASPLINADGSLRGAIEVARDITDHLSLLDEVKQQKDHLQHLAHHDSLTNLPNRVLFLDRLEQAINKAQRAELQLAVLFVDLDRFKEINDTLGHDFGDRVLTEVSRRFCDCLRKEDTIARLGGDEFTFISEQMSEPQSAALVAQKLIGSLASPFVIDGHPFFLTASIGISLYPQDGINAQTLLRNADAAMYKAKEEGKNTFQFYNEDMTEQAFERMFLEASLRRALENDELVVYYQAQVDTRRQTVIGVEALVRWRHPELGLISPAKFIPLAEETGLIVALGEQVLQVACRQVVAWRAEGLDPGKLSVNLSAKQLANDSLLEVLQRTLQDSLCRPEWLELEVTEGYLMKNPEQSIAIMEKIRALGVGLAIDDFGVGYSSLAYLKRFPVTRLKIDRSFVQDTPDDADDVAITRAVIALAKSLGLEVIAEGVENTRQRDFLIVEGCCEQQGFLFSKPVPDLEMTTLLQGGDLWRPESDLT